MSATATVPRVPEQRQPVPRIVDRFFEFSLLGMLAAGYFAVVGSGYLDWPTAALTLLGLCLRGLMVAGIVEFQFSNRFVAVVTLLGELNVANVSAYNGLLGQLEDKTSPASGHQVVLGCCSCANGRLPNLTQAQCAQYSNDTWGPPPDCSDATR